MGTIRRTYVALGLLLVVAFAVSSVGQGRRNNPHDMQYWIGAIAWATFGITLLVLVLLTLALAIRRGFVSKRS